MINIFNFLTLYSPKMNFNSPKYPIRILIISQNRTLSSDVVDFEPITNSFNDIEKHIDCIRKSEQTIRFIKSTVEPTFSIVLYSQVFGQISYPCTIENNSIKIIHIIYSKYQTAKIVIF